MSTLLKKIASALSGIGMILMGVGVLFGAGNTIPNPFNPEIMGTQTAVIAVGLWFFAIVITCLLAGVGIHTLERVKFIDKEEDPGDDDSLHNKPNNITETKSTPQRKTSDIDK